MAKYQIGERVIIRRLDGELEEGEIEDRGGGEYSIRTSQWREKKWYLEKEILYWELVTIFNVISEKFYKRRMLIEPDYNEHRLVGWLNGVCYQWSDIADAFIKERHVDKYHASVF